MWNYVRERFRRFVADLQLTPNQRDDGRTKHFNVGKALQRTYCENSDDYPPCFMVGSWGKETQVRPPRDLDMFFVLPWDVKTRFDGRSGNVQSQLLQEVKDVLATTYGQTTIRGDGQVVSVAFNTITIEVVPVFSPYGGQFLMADTHDGGSWKTVDPIAQINRLVTTDQTMNGNVRALSQMMKLWKYEKNVPLKSFVIELMVTDFLTLRGNGGYDTFWYDFYVRDFLLFMKSKANSFIIIPGTSDIYWLGDEWLSRVETAHSYAIKACELEYDDYQVLAGNEWQKIFGTRIPAYF